MADAAIEPQIEPELQGAVPRPLRFRTRTQVVRILLPSFFLSVLALLWLVLGLEQREQLQLAREGRTVEGRVTSKHMYTSKSPDYYVDYEFTLDGRTLAGYERVGEEVYERAREGGPLTITYLPSRPTVQRVGTVDPAHVAEAGRVTTWIIGVLALLFGGVTYYLERHFRRQLTLLQRGTPVLARIVECTGPADGRRYPTYTITYEYEVPGTGTITRTLPLNPQIGQQVAQQPLVTVLYHPRHPRESNLYLALDPQVE